MESPHPSDSPPGWCEKRHNGQFVDKPGLADYGLGHEMFASQFQFFFFYRLSVCASTTKKNIARLQKVQSFAARVATGARKFDHITPTLKQLH